MPNAKVTYTPHPDATPEGELNALADVYRFILGCQARKTAARPSTNGEDTKEINDGGEEYG